MKSDRVYQYGWLDKVTQITEGDKVIRSFRYHMDGQLAAAYDDSRTETFLWDGLALIRRDTTNYLNELAVTGGNPVIAGEKTLFNDLLGSTLGAKNADGFSAIERDAFGEVKPGETADLGINFFTGKPQVEGLGYTFLFRNYRPEQGKWQTSDPLGYPDGWNNLAYVNNGVTVNVDWLGAQIITPSGNFSMTTSLKYVETIAEANGLKTLSVSFTWAKPNIGDIILPPPFSPNVNSWYDYHSMRIEFVVRTYINEDQIDSETYLWLFDGNEKTWIPQGNNFYGEKTVSQASEGDIIKIVFSGDIYCSLAFGSDDTYLTSASYEERLDHIDDKFVVE